METISLMLGVGKYYLANQTIILKTVAPPSPSQFVVRY
jgi:hypothetical protein